VGVGKGAKNGILIKDAATLEKLHHASVVVFDKTGTITTGKPTVVSIKNYSQLSDADIIARLAALETKSEHPIARAVLQYATEKNIIVPEVAQFDSIKGKGISGTIDGIPYSAGNITLISDLKLAINQNDIDTATKQGQTPVLLCNADVVLAAVFVADTIKPAAAAAIQQLHDLNIKTVLVTGDNKNTATAIAKEVGIDNVIAEVLPGEKQEQIKTLQKNGSIIAMVGDGVNDAPALAQADIGIAMSTGTDVAIESAGITLLHGDITKVVQAIHLSKLTMRGIKQNLFWAFIYNIVGIPLAAGLLFPVFGWLLSPVFAGIAMAGSSVSVVMNSLRLRNKKL
jgi:heavy metal translocating P-type ATPase